MPIYDDMYDWAKDSPKPEPARTSAEEGIGSGLPGDSHGRLADPEPFKGRQLSKNPHVEISPDAPLGIPDGSRIKTIERPYDSRQKLTSSRGQSSESYGGGDSPRHKSSHSEGLRKLVKP